MAEPVTLAEARAQVNIVDAGDTTFDGFLTSLIAPARAYVEKETGLSFVAGERVFTFGAWGDYLEIFLRPIASVEVTYGPDGSGTTYTGQSNLNAFPFRFYPAADDAFPTLAEGETITATVTTGALDSASLEYLLGKRAMLLLIGFWFENRGEIPLDKDTEFAVESLLDDLRPVSAY